MTQKVSQTDADLAWLTQMTWRGAVTFCSTENGVYMGTANPFYGTQLWRMYSAEDKPLVKEHTHQWSDTWSSDGENHWHDCLADGCTVTDNSQKDGFGAHTFVDGVCSVCGYQQTGSGSGGDAGGSGGARWNRFRAWH